MTGPLYITECPSPVGQLLLAASETRLHSIWFEDAWHAPTDGIRRDDLPLFHQVRHWLDRYFAGEKPDPAQLPLAPRGTAFQTLVWDLLLEIPYGQAKTYGQLAREAASRLGKERMSPQAVGNAVGRNPISIVVPCHRVLGAGGSLTGFSGGLDRKKFLLDLENIPCK